MATVAGSLRNKVLVLDDVTTGSLTVTGSVSGNVTFGGEIYAKDSNSTTDPTVTFTGHTTTGMSIYHTGTEDELNLITGGVRRVHVNGAGVTSFANVYTGSSSSFRNYGGTWKATTGLTGNGFEFSNSVDGTAMTLSSVGLMSLTGASAGVVARKGAFGPSQSGLHASYDLYNNGTTYLNGAVTVDDNLTVTGDLNITGDINSYNVTDLDVTDKTITLGAGQTEAQSGGSGIVIDGSLAEIKWDESDDRWESNKTFYAATVNTDTITATANTDLQLNATTNFKLNLGGQTWISAERGGSTSPTNFTYFTGRLEADDFKLYEGTIDTKITHNGDTDTYIQFDTDRIRLFAGGTAKFDSNNTYQTTTGSGAGLTSLNASNITSGTLNVDRLQDRIFDSYRRSTINTSSHDFNTYLTTGTYHVDNWSDSADVVQNGPTGSYPWGLLRVTNWQSNTGTSSGTGTYVLQEYFPHNTDHCFHRIMWNGSFTGWRESWGSGSDGSGSGLDADKVDGIQASSFLRSDTADTATGDIDFARASFGSASLHTTGGTHGVVTDSFSLHSSGSDLMYIRPSALRADNGFFQWQTYNGGNGGDIELQPYGGSVTISTGSATTSASSGLRFQTGSGSYSDGRWQHRFRKEDKGGGIPLYIDVSTTTANSFTELARFGTYTGNNYEFEVQGDINATGNLYDGGNQVFHEAYHPNADKWTTSRTLSLTGDVTGSVSWDGSGNATMTTTVADNSHTHDTWNLNAAASGQDIDTAYANKFWSQDRGTQTTLGTYPTTYSFVANLGGGKSQGIQLASQYGTSKDLWFRTGTDNSSSENGANVWKNWRKLFHDDYHPNADKWTSSRTLTLAGDLSGSVSFDGSANFTLTAAVADDSHNHIISNVDGLQAALDGKLDTSFDHAQSHKTWTGINAASTQAKRYHIARLYGCPAHWDGDWQNIEFTVTAESYESGYLKFRLMGDYGGAGSQANMIKIFLTEAQGPMIGRFQFVLGSPVDAGWDYSGQDTFYVDLYAEASHYSQWKVNAKTYGHGYQTSNPSSGGATTVFYTSPTTTNTTTFNVSYNDTYIRGYKIWNELNDGSGSGLDADKLDNQDGSYYLDYNNFTNTPTVGANYYLDGITKSGNTLTFSVNGTTNQTYTFGSNAFNSTTIPTNNNQLTNGAGYTTFTANQSLNTSSSPTFNQITTTNNGNGTNIKIGDDAWFGDTNVANTIQVTGVQDGTKGYIVFGSSDNTALGRSGTGNLTYGSDNVFHDGYHPNADKWTTSRTLTLSGDVTGSTSWDGSGNATITTAVANNSHEHSQLYENGTITFGASYVQWTDQSGTGGTGLNGAAPRNPANGWYHNLIMNHGNSGGYYSQIATGLNTSDIYFSRVQNGTAQAWQRIFADDYHPNADKWTTARTISLTGAVTGSTSIDGSGNVSITTTATSDPTLTLSGDASGSATFTNLGNATLNVTINNDSHNHNHSDGDFTVNGGLVVEGSKDSGGTDYGFYQSAGTNIILKGDSNGRSGIFFESEKDGTNINDPSDYGFIQFHAYGYGGTSGESIDMVIGTANDSADHVIIQSPYNGGVKVGYKDATSGTGLTTQTVFHDAYHPNADKWTTSRTLTLSGDVTGSTSWDGSGNATITTTVADDSHNHGHSDGDFTVNGNLYGKYANNAYSNCYRFGGYYFTWDSDNYGTNTNHSIRSTYGDTYGDEITLNSYNHIRLNIDSNNNDATSYFEVGHHTTDTANILMRLTSPSGNLEVDGNVTAYSSSISDAKYKDNIEPLKGSLDKVLQLQGVEFDWTATSRKGMRDIGFIAQEVEPIVPEVVQEHQNGVGEFSQKEETSKSIAYDKLVPLLVESIKELKAEIDDLKEQLKKK